LRFSLLCLAGALVAGAAAAHVVADPNEGPAGGYLRTALRIGHGCGSSPTVAVRVKIPDGVLTARPQVKPGWEITVTKKKLATPVDNGHGGLITETVDEIAWRGGPLPDGFFDEFGLNLRLPSRPVGEIVYLPTVQECANGVHRWIEIPVAGQRWGDMKEPAPFIRLVAPPAR
jgi:uncharacterized protein YcnI